MMMPQFQVCSFAVLGLMLSCFHSDLLAAEREYRGDVADVVTIDTLEENGPYDKIWEPLSPNGRTRIWWRRMACSFGANPTWGTSRAPSAAMRAKPGARGA